MLTAAAGRRALVHAALVLFIYLTRCSSGSSYCTLASQIANATKVIRGAAVTNIPSGCSLLGSTAETIASSPNITLFGDADTTGSLDTQFATDAVNLSRPDSRLIVWNLRLLNVRLEVDPFLQLSAFQATTQQLYNVVIETDCQTVYALASSSVAGNGNISQGAGYLYVGIYNSSAVQALNVNVTCQLPQIQSTPSGELALVNDSLQLLNALVASQLPAGLGGSQGPLTIYAAQNISLSLAVWRPTQPLTISRNVAIVGNPNTLNVLDLQGLVRMVQLGTGVTISLESFYLVNAGPLRGMADIVGTQAIFSIPVWFFQFPRVPTAPQVRLANVVLVLPSSEFEYFKIWTVIVTNPMVYGVSAPLREGTPIIDAYPANSTSIGFRQLMGSGLDGRNLTLTAVLPPVPSKPVVIDNPNLTFEGTLVPNTTHLPIYDTSDLVAVLEGLQNSTQPYQVVLYLLSNVTVDPAVWPAVGFHLSVPVRFVGLGNVGILTWIDFRRVPVFIRAEGCAPNMSVFMTGVTLLNLPNGAQPAALLAGAGAGAAAGLAAEAAAAAAASGLSDVSVYISNIFSDTEGCAGPTLYTNHSTVVITYAEYKLVRALVGPYLGTSKTGSGTVLNSTILFNLSDSADANTIAFRDLQGWGWKGYSTSLAYAFPADMPVMYNNTYDPSLLNQDSGLSKDDHLSGWKVALIVIGAVVFAALLTSLIAWHVVRRLRPEVKTLKSANSDKKSSSASGDQEAVTGATRLGSCTGINGGGLNAGDNGMPGSPAAAKCSTAGGGGGAAAAGAGGTSDDSTAPNDRPPLEVLNNMMTALTQEMDDRHLAILEVIGQGGFGVVYRGQWKGLNVAVKTITFQDRVAGGEKAQHRAILEAAISSSLSHPNVVTTYSYDIKPLTVQGSTGTESPTTGSGGNAFAAIGVGGGTGGGFKIVDKRPVLDWKLYLIQEYCDGGSLRTAILKRKFFDSKRGEPRMEMILDTCLELAGGLVHLHERNIVHGDLNPNNVLLKRDSTKKYGAICKIADFGLSIKMGADQSHISNMRRGTPFYTCPQILARGNMTKAADVYSMGVMMWEMYHCCMSYRSLPSGFQARDNFPLFPRKAPHEFAGLVGACLHNEPVHRPSFPQLRTEFEALLAALKRGELRSTEEVLGPDPAGDAAHTAACQD